MLWVIGVYIYITKCRNIYIYTQNHHGFCLFQSVCSTSCVLFNQWRLNGWLVMWQIGYLNPPQYFTQYLHELGPVYRDRGEQLTGWSVCVSERGGQHWIRPKIILEASFEVSLKTKAEGEISCNKLRVVHFREVAFLHLHDLVSPRSGNSDTQSYQSRVISIQQPEEIKPEK